MVKKVHPGDTPGNAIESQWQHEKWLMRIGRDVLLVDQFKWEPTEHRPVVTQVVLKCDPDDEGGCLGIVKGYTPHEPVVAFQRGEDLTDVVIQIGRRLKNNSLKWREDKPYGG